jgi:hypothetical protein
MMGPQRNSSANPAGSPQHQPLWKQLLVTSTMALLTCAVRRGAQAAAISTGLNGLLEQLLWIPKPTCMCPSVPSYGPVSTEGTTVLVWRSLQVCTRHRLLPVLTTFDQHGQCPCKEGRELRGEANQRDLRGRQGGSSDREPA